jgi:hypothetical protein
VAAYCSQNVQVRGRHLEKVAIPIQRGFIRHSAMLAPMTVKNIAITMMIAAQRMTWIVAIGGL